MLLAGYMLTAGVASPALGQQPLKPAFPDGIHLVGEVRGEAAIAALGQRLPEVAAYYRKTPDELRALFRADHSLRANPQGWLFYVCDAPPEANAAEQSAIIEEILPIDNPPFATNETFLLHSRPGANRVIYLDFDGHVDNTPGRWKDGAAEPAFDLDGDTNSFSTTERNRIVYIWQRVAEDFAMYEIDVTTEEPGIEALRKTSTSDQSYGVRVVIGGSSCDWYGCGAGGVAFVGSFDDSEDTPCWVFPKSLGNSEKNIAEAASHEAGHTLGLGHDGTTTGSAYYSGQGNWAPIMGVGYSKPIVQWSKGEYANANQLQDDLAVMLNNGAVYRTDDHGNNTAAATLLSTVGSSASTNGVIERNTDQDFFRFTAGGGLVTITVARPPRDSNLRLQVILYDSGGTPILTNTPADSSTSGTQSSVSSLSLAAGNYFVSVDGVGNGNPLTTGYSDYASLGQYTVTVSGTAPPGPLWQPTVAGTYSWTNVPNWLPSPPNAAGIIALINNNITGDQTIQLPSAVTLGTLNLGDANDTHAFNLQPVGGALTFNNSGSPAALNKVSGLDDVIAAPLTLASSLNINHSSIGRLTLSGPIGGAGALTKSGTGTTTLAGTNSYTGVTTVSDGVLRLDRTNALGNGNLVIDGGVIGLSGVDLTNRTIGTGNLQVRWTGDGGFAAYGAPQKVKFQAASINWVEANFISSANNLILGAEDSDATLIWEQPFSLAGGARTIQVNDGSAAIDAKMTGAVAGGNVGTYVNHFIKTGGGTLAFAVQPSYRGNTTVSGGTLMLGDGTSNTGGVSLNTTNILVSGGATLAVNLTGTLTQGGAALPAVILGDGEFAQVGPGTTVLTLSNEYTGPTTISSGTLQLGASEVIPDGPTNGNVALDGTLDLNAFSETINGLSGTGVVDSLAGGAPTFTVGAGDQAGNFSGAIKNSAGSLALTKAGTNSLTLSGTNTYSGGTTLAGGIISASSSSALGQGALTFAGGARLVIGTDLTITNPIVVNSNSGVVGRGLIEPVSGTATVSGPITLNSGASAGGHFGYTSGTLALSGPITASVTAVQRNGTVVYSGGGTGYGNLTVAQGTAKVGASNGIATSATISIANSGAASLDLNGYDQSVVGVVKSANAATIGNSSTTSDSTLTTTGTNTYAGLIQDALGSGTRKVKLTVAGGQLTLTGTNAYSGGTTINAGTLLVSNTNLNGSGTGTGNVTVNNGGTLGGTGRIAGIVTNNAGGNLAPGASIGTLILGSGLVLNAGSTNTFEVNGSTPANDVVLVGGSVNYGGVLNIVTNGTFTTNQSFVLFSGAGATTAGNFSSIAGSPGVGQAFAFTNGVLSVVAAVSTPPATTLTNSYSGGVLGLSWPAGQGWRLQEQTNALSKGLSTNWVDVTPGSASLTNITVNPTKAATFYRLVYP
ncbi:MAG: hypothetical protein RLY20_1864 [Verrucomicrobiota bacterium]